MRDRLGYPADGLRHGDLGDQVLWYVLPFWLLTVALVLLDRRRPAGRSGGRQPWGLLLVAVLAVGTGFAATAQVIRTGDSGAESVWTGRIP